LIISLLPDGSNQSTKTITLEANLQIVDMDDLDKSISFIEPLQKAEAAPIEDETRQTTISTIPNKTTELADLPIPDNLKKKEITYLHEQETVSAGDSLSTILAKHGVSATDIYRVSQADKKENDLLKMRPGQTLEFEIQESTKELQKLTLVKSKLEKIEFIREDKTFNSTRITREPDLVQTYKESIINNSLFVDGLKSGIDQRLLIEMANIFGWDIDFALDIRKGDTFSILYEEKYLDGEQIGLGNILAAQFINNGRMYQAIRYATNSGSSYYTPDGLAMRKAFLRTPVEFTRISSKFNPNRIHPLFKTSRPHRGVDYAASSGTPVKSAGDGKVSFAGKQNGYGNVVIIDHGKGYTTLYAHLRSFARGTRKGARVKQGKTIAYVGQTGWATGPHLHYEFRINGVHKNPVTVKLPNDDPMPKKDLKKYLPYSKKITSMLEGYHSMEYQEKLANIRN
jgi:murein DD-endopeptidase MepM/ murein hydrolase activator NlpD